MNKLLLPLLLFIQLQGIAQSSDTTKQRELKHKLINSDSTFQKLEKFRDSMLQSYPAIDSNQSSENMDRGFSWILELQKERRAKEKRGAIIRIAIGIGFLVVLVIGLRRRRVKK